MDRKVKLPKYVHAFVDRHGKARHYLRRPGFKRVPLPGLPWSTSFMDLYQMLMEGADPTVRIAPGARRHRPGSFNAALGLYFGSVAFHELAPASRKSRRWLLEKFARETGSKENPTPRGERQLAGLDSAVLAQILGRLGPHPRRSTLKALRHFAGWACTERLIATDPTAGMKLPKVPKTSGFYSWTDSDITKFETAHTVGSKARLAFALMLFLGLRRADAIRIGPMAVREGKVIFKPQKTAKSTGFTLECPLHPELERVIAATAVIGTQNYLISERGTPFSPSGFSNFMRAACNAAGLPEASSHGLRKACARRLIDAGMDVTAVAAITGHQDLRELQVYIAAHDRRLAAERAVAAMRGPKGEHKLANQPIQFAKSAKKVRGIKAGK